jgi:5'-nucleotidase
MKKLFLGICLLASFLATDAAAQRRLTIIHVNDTHSHLEPERSGAFVGRGGAIERAAYRDSVVKADGNRNVLFLHAGDFSQGTSYFSTLGGDIEIDILNAMEYDCVTLGNHEFDNGVDELARRLSNLKCHVVCANYDFTGLKLSEYVRPYVILKKAGMKIGIIGLMPNITKLVAKSVSEKITSFDNAEVVNKWADYLKNGKKCDLVIVLSHIGFTDEEYVDPYLVSQTRNVDLVVGGHSHTYLDEVYYGKNLEGQPVPIVQDGEWGLNVGNMKIGR